MHGGGRGPGRPCVEDAVARAGSVVTDDVSFRILREPVNVDFIRTYVHAHYDALEQVKIRGLPATTVLLSFIMRAVDGYVRAVWVECRGGSPWASRRYSGVLAARALDEEAQEKIYGYFANDPAPRVLQGLSAFALPKELRFVVRMGCDVTDFDQKCAHLAIQLARVDTNPGAYPAIPISRRYEADPPAFRAATACEKTVLLAAIYGGDPPAGSHVDVHAFAAEQVAVRHADMLLHLVDFPEWLTDEKAERTLQYYKNQSGEQARQMELEQAIRDVGGVPVSLEHDGIPAEKAAGKLSRIQAKLNFKVDVKPYPDADGALDECRARWSCLQWGLSRKPHSVNLELARMRVERLVESGKVRCHESFGRYVALYYMDTLAVADVGAADFSWFDAKRCIWRECNKTWVERLVTEALPNKILHK